MDQLCDQNSQAIVASSFPLGWDGLSVARGRMDAPVFDRSASPEHHFCMIVRNRLTWECGDDGRRLKTITTRPGQIAIYPADHMATRRIASPFEFIALMLAPEKLHQGLKDIRLKNRLEFRMRHNLDDPQLRGMMTALLGEAEAGNPNGRLFVDSLTLALSIHYVKQYAVERVIPAENQYGLSAHQRRRILDYIEDNLSDDLSLESMAVEIGLSKYYFCTLFKKTMGQTPYQYVLQRRLERAKALLQHGDIDIAGAASFFGFSDQSHFSRSFKKLFGTTPGKYVRHL